MQKTYVGMVLDQYGGMTATGAIIKDAWLFGLLPETETCAGWDLNRIQSVYDQTQVEWDKYGCLVSNLPPALRERHGRIHAVAIERAKSLGWEPEMYLSE